MTILTGCASGSKFADTSIAPLAVGKGRIYFYRTTALGAAVQPDVKLNGEKIGDAVPKGFFWADLAPGSYQIQTSTEVKRHLSLTLEPDQTRYVRLNMAMGFFVGHVWPELVENAVGEKEIQKCKSIARQ
jgi:hypothetical protein